MNNITVVGTVSRAVEDKNYGTAGKSMSVFTIEDKDPFSRYPDFVKVTVFGTLRDKLQEVRQGALVCVIGKAKAEGYLGKRDNKPKAVLSVNAREVTVLGQFGNPEAEPEPAAPAAEQPAASGEAPSPEGEDVPF